MNLLEDLKYLQSALTKISLCEEELSKAHLTHPEDVIFIKGPIAGVSEVVSRMNQTLENPTQTTIKWDGSPALIFGYGSDMKFRIMDKHMFDKTDPSGRNVLSPKQFKQYDINRGVERGNLAQVIAILWPNLQKITPRQPGYYWGDLLWPETTTSVTTQPQSFSKDNSQFFYFKPNPTGVLYRIEVDSDVGKQISGKKAGIAVHQFIPGDAPEKADEINALNKQQGKKEKVKPTDFAQSLDGSLGNLQPNLSSEVSVLPSSMNVSPNFDKGFSKIFRAEAKKLQDTAKKLEPTINSFIGPITGANKTTNDTFHSWLMSYINYEVRKLGLSGSPEEQKQKVNNLLKVIGNDFGEYIKLQLPKIKVLQNQQLIIDHINNNLKGMKAAYQLWAQLYNLKMMFYNQIDVAGKQSPVKGFIGKDSDIESQEGYVAHGLKYVDRLGGFSAQHLANRG